MPRAVQRESGLAEHHPERLETGGVEAGRFGWKANQPTLHAGPDAAMTSLEGQTIHPFTDLLLHDMGEGLADHRPDFEATGSEWRTPPLWGLSMQQTVSGHLRLLHDGRARGFAEAILWHCGEADRSRTNYTAMTAADRAALIRFLESL